MVEALERIQTCDAELSNLKSLKIPALHLQGIKMDIRNEHVARLNDRLWFIAWVRSAPCASSSPLPAGILNSVSRSAGADRSKSCCATRCTTSPSRWMGSLIAIIEKPGTTCRRFSNSDGQTTILAGPVSSSMVITSHPWPVPASVGPAPGRPYTHLFDAFKVRSTRFR